MKITIEHLQKIVQGLPNPDTCRTTVMRVPFIHLDAQRLPTADSQLYYLTFAKVRYFPEPGEIYCDWRREFTWELQL